VNDERMKKNKRLRSGMIEAYVFRFGHPLEAKEVEEMAAARDEVRAAIHGGQIRNDLSNAIAPDLL